jgi:CheY-like chemotaxis protein
LKHVVVVEDDPVNAILFQKLLERRGGYRVTMTESPEHLLQLARDGEVDLVVMDVSLGESYWQGKAVSGVEICRMLKSEPATAGIPVVLATAHAMRGDDEKLIAESGADGYVSKPIVDHDAFLAQVRRWMSSEAA